MAKLGKVVIYVNEGATIGGLIFCDESQKPIAGDQLKITPANRDTLHVEFKVIKPEPKAKSSGPSDTSRD